MKHDVEWDGQGLPPVGAVVRSSRGFTEPAEVKIEYIDEYQCVLSMEGVDKTHSFPTEELIFAPIKNPREVAIDEMKEIIDAIFWENLINSEGMLSDRYMMGVLYDAGYRKVEV